MNKYANKSLKMLLLSLSVVALLQTTVEGVNFKRADRTARDAEIKALVEKTKLELTEANATEADRERTDRNKKLKEIRDKEERASFEGREGAFRTNINKIYDDQLEALQIQNDIGKEMAMAKEQWRLFIEKRIKAEKALAEAKKNLIIKQNELEEATKKGATKQISEAEKAIMLKEYNEAMQAAQAEIDTAEQDLAAVQRDAALEEAKLKAVVDKQRLNMEALSKIEDEMRQNDSGH